MSPVRTRFAPSPTGYLHIGNFRTALYAYLFARRHQGTFILRIEDTDQERYVPEAVDFIYRTMREIGLTYDEGPDVGGSFGPYVQSERKEIYAKHAEILLEKGAAYRCFCSKDRLTRLHDEQELLKQAPKYDGLCRRLSAEDVQKKLAAGESFTIRQAIPSGRTVSFHDVVFGDISVQSDELDDNVLMKSAGLPTYNFANVVDDHLMEISHVIRGMEYISSTPKYILLYEAFGWDAPIHVHLPPIMKTATKKLSKREGDASFTDLVEAGFLKEAILNDIALLGWHPSNDREMYTLSELEEAFDLDGIQKSPAIFDPQKLIWLNREYLKLMDHDAFHTLALPRYPEELKATGLDLALISRILKERIDVLNDIPAAIDFFVALPEYDVSLFEHAKSKSTRETGLRALEWTCTHLAELEPWTEEAVRAFFVKATEELGLSTGQVLWPIRIALSGKQFTPGGAIEIMHILGKGTSEERLKVARQKLVA